MAGFSLKELRHRDLVDRVAVGNCAAAVTSHRHVSIVKASVFLIRGSLFMGRDFITRLIWNERLIEPRRDLVPGAGIEPARPFRAKGF